MSAGAPGSGRALICGSLAFDTIMVFGDRFANHILPDMIHILNVSFLVPQMRREYGGCAGNIAYNLALLGDDGVPRATSPHKPSSPPISMTTRSPPSTPARCSTVT